MSEIFLQEYICHKTNNNKNNMYKVFLMKKYYYKMFVKE